MPEYRVYWSVDVEANSHREAAEEAQRLQQTSREDYWCGTFEVDGRIVDLDDGCSTCGTPLDDGEGYDGLCGSCADRKENS